jgi:hypothetical protein
MGLLPCYSGSYFRVEFLTENGGCPAKEFLEDLAANAKSPRFRMAQRIHYALRRLADNPPGSRLSAEVFKQVTDSDAIFEFRAFQARLFCFFASAGRVILTNGIVKKKDKIPPKSIEKAELMRKRFLEAESKAGTNRRR